MVRNAYDFDRSAVKELWNVCFDDIPAFVDWSFDKNYSTLNTVVSEANNKVVSAMQMIPFTMRIKEQPFLSRGIWGVSTYPKHRNKGHVREMFEFAMPSLFSDGCEICVLAAAVEGMYEKFGYSNTFDIKFFRLADTNFDYAEKIDYELILKLDNIYRVAMSDMAVYAERTYEYWEKTLNVLKNIYSGKIALTENGYALLYPDKNGCVASEVFGIKTAEAVNSFPLMARVINVKSVLEKLAVYIEDGTVIKVHDELIADNNICFSVNGGEITECDSEVRAMDISEFTDTIFDLLGGKESIYINFPLEI